MSYSKISVLMSTYNGEKYICEQVDSILQQKGVDVQLLIRDDGSKDRTVEVIKKYVLKNSNLSIYEGENVGVGKSFMELLQNAPYADYYAFADQDDVWLEDKLARAVGMIQEAEKSESCQGLELRVPILYTSNQMVVDENLHSLGMRFDKTPGYNLLDIISKNQVSGCTMVMNKELRAAIIKEEAMPNEKTLNLRLHDTWCMVVANIVGKVIYDDSGRILYRQHSNNVVGAKELSRIDVLKDKINRFIRKKYKGSRSTIASEVINLFDEFLSDYDKKNLEDLANCKSVKGALRLIGNLDLRAVFRESTLILFAKAVTGWI